MPRPVPVAEVGHDRMNSVFFEQHSRAPKGAVPEGGCAPEQTAPKGRWVVAQAWEGTRYGIWDVEQSSAFCSSRSAAAEQSSQSKVREKLVYDLKPVLFSPEALRNLPRGELKLRVRSTVTTKQWRQAARTQRWATFKVAVLPCWPSSSEQAGRPRESTGHGCGSLPQPCVGTSCTASFQRLGCGPRKDVGNGNTFTRSTDCRPAPARWLRPGSAMAAAWKRRSPHGPW